MHALPRGFEIRRFDPSPLLLCRPGEGLGEGLQDPEEAESAPFFAELFEEAYDRHWAGRTIVPVPPRPGKERIQGWDQVEEIVRILERRGYAAARPLERRRSGEQKSLGRGERGANAKRAYTMRSGASAPLQALLVDDVVTTCATLDACAMALKLGGAVSVAALVFAAD